MEPKDKETDQLFQKFQKSIYKTIVSEYVEIWHAGNEESFVREIFGPMILRRTSGDEFVEECRTKNSLYRREQVLIACAYLTESVKSKAFGQDHLAWTYLMDAQRFASMALYANQLQREMPGIEEEVAAEAVKSHKRKGGQVSNKVNRLIADKAVALIKARGEQGERWAKIYEAVRAIKPELWPFMLQTDPERLEKNYKRSIRDHLTKRSSEISQFFSKEKQWTGEKWNRN